jgi:cell division protein FtsN
MNKSSSKSNPQSAFRLILGLVAVAAAGIVLIVVFLAPGSPAPEPTETPTPTRPATAPPPTPTQPQSPISPLDTPESVQAAATLPAKPPTLTPVPRPEVPEVAPAFTLNRAGGGTFILQNQLEEGPVVLVFFERCG